MNKTAQMYLINISSVNDGKHMCERIARNSHGMYYIDDTENYCVHGCKQYFCIYFSFFASRYASMMSKLTSRGALLLKVAEEHSHMNMHLCFVPLLTASLSAKSRNCINN